MLYSSATNSMRFLKSLRRKKSSRYIHSADLASSSTTSKVAIVTGGSRGIGKSIAVALLAANYRIAVLSKSDLCFQTASALSEQVGRPGAALGFKVDVNDTFSLPAAFKEVEAALGPVDVLVNNAGISKDGLLLRLNQEDLQSTLNTNLIAPILLSQQAVKSMIRRKSQGDIIMIGSVVSEHGNVGQVAYAASKAGLLGAAKSLALELRSKGIRVNTVSPGFVKTDMTKDLKIDLTGKDVHPDEVAKAVLYLLDSPHISGQNIIVNGPFQPSFSSENS